MTSGLVIQNSARFSYNNPRLSFAFEGDLMQRRFFNFALVEYFFDSNFRNTREWHTDVIAARCLALLLPFSLVFTRLFLFIYCIIASKLSHVGIGLLRRSLDEVWPRSRREIIF